MGSYYGVYFIAIIIGIVSFAVSSRLKSKFKKYSQTPLSTNYSGAEIAKKMLADHGIYDVQVVNTPGMLTDHYNPRTKTVNLSEGVYEQRNAAAAAVAAHEVGHAVQHADAYTWLKMRSALVPIVSVSSKFMTFVLIGGILLLNRFPELLLIGIIMFSLTTLFSIITLPVEYDASRRALAWMKNKNVVSSEEHRMSKDALKWAARTYVVAALGSIATLLYYVSIFMGGRRR